MAPIKGRKTLASLRKDALARAGVALPARLVRTVAVAWKVRPEIKALINDLVLEMSVELRERISMADVMEDAIEFFARQNYPELAELHLAERAEDTANTR